MCNVARKEPTSIYHRCGYEEDTAQHALESCPEEVVLRQSLLLTVCTDLSLPTVLNKMVDKESSWQAMVTFCEAAVKRRVAEEREREVDPNALPPRRARRRGQAYLAGPSTQRVRPGAPVVVAASVPH